MNVPLLDLKVQFDSIRNEVIDEVLGVIESQRFIMGPAVGELEDAVAQLCGTRFGIACASGTDALLLSLRALIQPGDEVITTPFTFFATAGAITNAGGTPRFVDIDPATFNIDTDLAAGAIGERTRAMVPVHLFGQMAPIEKLTALAKEHDLAIVEDAAQAIGARRKIDGAWRMAGELGTTGTFSFFPSKNLGGWGDGGMVVTQDEQLAGRLRRLRTHGGAKQYYHDEVGINSRLDTIQAAVLKVKLPHLQSWSAARREHAAFYNEALGDCPGVVTPVADEANEHIYHQYTIRADRRDDLVAALKDAGIGCAVYYPKPLHLQPCFAVLGYAAGRFPETERASQEVLSLPVYPELPVQAREAVVGAIREFYQ